MGTEKLRARDVTVEFAAAGRYHFSTSDMRSALGISAAATRMALSRLAKKGAIASPARGFYVILPPEYRRLGCLPADQFVPALMEHLRQPYYAALLSAAQYHGAAHHRPQAFQVALTGHRRPIACGAVLVSFIVRKRIAETAVQSFNTPRGTIRVSSAEATALDLVGYEKRAGGLDQVATVLSELAGRIDPELLAMAARTVPVPWAQRLGFLLELIGAADKTAPLKAHVQRQARSIAPLLPSGPRDGARRSADWRLHINAEAEAEA